MKIFTGKVISKKSAKTLVVNVERIVSHPIYKKKLRRTRKYHVHDELGAKEGDIVKFVASKPYSKLKRWKTLEIVGKKGRKSK